MLEMSERSDSRRVWEVMSLALESIKQKVEHYSGWIMTRKLEDEIRYWFGYYGDIIQRIESEKKLKEQMRREQVESDLRRSERVIEDLKSRLQKKEEIIGYLRSKLIEKDPRRD